MRTRRVVIMADTCHSAGMATGARTAGDLGAAALNRYLDQLGNTEAGVAYLTSAREDQRSMRMRSGRRERVFTWYLLEGMRGS